MTDVTQAMQAKSDQLNAVDITGIEPILTIRKVDVKAGDQPVSIFFDGDNNRPWKPSKGMIRMLAGGWGTDSAGWVGKQVQVYCDNAVIYAGKAVGGIRIRAMSDIPQAGLKFVLTISRQKREPYHIEFLPPQVLADYPADHFTKALPAMAEMMQSGKMSLQQVIAQCNKTGKLSAEQVAQLEVNAPTEIDEDNGDIT